jgi:hypothetical protein
MKLLFSLIALSIQLISTFGQDCSVTQEHIRVSGTKMFFLKNGDLLQESTINPKQFINEKHSAFLNFSMSENSLTQFENSNDPLSLKNKSEVFETLNCGKLSGNLIKYSVTPNEVNWWLYLGNENEVYEATASYPKIHDESLNEYFKNIFSKIAVNPSLEIPDFEELTFTFEYKKYSYKKAEEQIPNGVSLLNANKKDSKFDLYKLKSTDESPVMSVLAIVQDENSEDTNKTEKYEMDSKKISIDWIPSDENSVYSMFKASIKIDNESFIMEGQILNTEANKEDIRNICKSITLKESKK